MAKNTSVSLGHHFDKFISQQINLGHYGSTSETIRAGLKLLEEKETKIAALRKALIDGEESRRSRYSLESFKKEGIIKKPKKKASSK